jgi:hypothetical protein
MFFISLATYGAMSIWVKSATFSRAAIWVIVAVTIVMSIPRVYPLWPRWLRDVIRGWTGFLVAVLFIWLSLGLVLQAATLAVVLGVAWRIFQVTRRQRSVQVCQGCPEYQPHETRICSGFSRQAEAFRKFDDAAMPVLTRCRQRQNANAPR